MKWLERRQIRRREQERRSSEPRPTTEVQTDRRRSDRRQAQRRALDRRLIQRRHYFRVIYPPDEAPTVLNADYRIVDLSQNAIKFACTNGSRPHIELGNPVDARLQFRDGDIFDVRGKITRIEQSQNGDETLFVCVLDELVPQDRVNNEQRYLLKNYPHFCRVSFDRRRIVLEN